MQKLSGTGYGIRKKVKRGEFPGPTEILPPLGVLCCLLSKNADTVDHWEGSESIGQIDIDRIMKKVIKPKEFFLNIVLITSIPYVVNKRQFQCHIKVVTHLPSVQVLYCQIRGMGPAHTWL